MKLTSAQLDKARISLRDMKLSSIDVELNDDKTKVLNIIFPKDGYTFQELENLARGMNASLSPEGSETVFVRIDDDTKPEAGKE